MAESSTMNFYAREERIETVFEQSDWLGNDFYGDFYWEMMVTRWLKGLFERRFEFDEWKMSIQRNIGFNLLYSEFPFASI